MSSANQIGGVTTILLPVLVGLIGSIIHALLRQRRGKDPLPVIAIWWIAVLMWGHGTIALAFWLAEGRTAHQIGYTVSPFELEVSGANLAMFVGLLIGLRLPSWRLPVVAVDLIFLWFAAGQHIVRAFAFGDWLPGNGPAIWINDILAPLFAFIPLLILTRRPQRNESL